MGIKEETAAKPAWSPDEITCRVIEAGTPSHDRMTNAARGRGQHPRDSTVLYDVLALTYNQMAPGNLLVVKLPNHPSVSNLRKIIKDRGLNDEDFRIYSPLFDEHGQRYPKNKRPVILRRFTDKKMRTVQTFTALAENIAKEAAQRGISHNFSQSEAPINPGPV